MDRAIYMLWYNFTMFNLDDERTEVMSQDITPAMREQASKPKKTWFFERGDGKILAVEEREAWQICYNRSTWKRRDFRLLGTSDGTTYHRIVKESIVEAKVLEPKIAEKNAELERYQKAEENLVINETVDMEGDPSDVVNEENKQKVLRLRKIIDRIHAELDLLEDQYKTVTADIVTQATNAELEVAKKNQAARVAQGLDVDWPDENLNIQTPSGSHKPRKVILSQLGRIG